MSRALIFSGITAVIFLCVHAKTTDDISTSKPAAKKKCLPIKTAPKDDGGLVATGALWFIDNATAMPKECGTPYWHGDKEPTKVPDYCCSAKAGAIRWQPFEEVFATEKCVQSHPFGEAAKISPALVSGCAADGTQFYGEKCGGSDFSGLPKAAQDITYGSCGPLKEKCQCFTYVETKSPGCYAVAVPDPSKQVLFRAGGCVKAHAPVPADKRTPEMAAKIIKTQDTGALALNFEGDPRALDFQMSKGVKPTFIVEVEKFPSKKNLVAFNFPKEEVGSKLFPLLADGTLATDSDGGALFTDEQYWVSGNRIFQHFHFGYEKDENSTIVWGYATFTYTGLPPPGMFKYESTGYQIEDDFFCLGGYDYCEAEAKKYFKDKSYFKELRFGGGGSKHKCLPIKTAPKDDGGLVATGALWFIDNATAMPKECGTPYWHGDKEPTKVPDYCCSAKAGAIRWQPFEEVFATEKCVQSHPFGEAAKISPALVSGCAVDGTQFYGEKCGGSDFSGLPKAAQDITYGSCGPLKEKCQCFTYVETKSPGCYAVAVPDPSKQVLFRAGGCVKAHAPVPADKRTPEMAAKIIKTQDTGALALNFEGDPRALDFQMSKGVKPTFIVEVEKFPSKKNLVAFNFPKEEVGSKLFPLLADGTLATDSDGGALFTDEQYWVSGNRIFQHFHFGYEKDENSTIVWGYATFTYTGLPPPGMFKYESTGYQIEDDFFCLGGYDYCEAEAKKYFKDKSYFKELRFDGGSKHPPKPTDGATTGLLIKSDNACITMGAKGDTTICRVGPNEVKISGDIIINGKSLKTFMDRLDNFIQRISGPTKSPVTDKK